MDERILFWGLGGLLGLAGLGLLYWALFHDRAKGRKRCPKCWYDMSYTSEGDPLRCPECKYVAKTERRLYKTNRKWRLVLLGGGFVLVSGFVGRWPEVQRYGWRGIVPNTVLLQGMTSPFHAWCGRTLRDRFDHAPYGGGKYSAETLTSRQWMRFAREGARMKIVPLGVLDSIPSPWDEEAVPFLLEELLQTDDAIQSRLAGAIKEIMMDSENGDLRDAVVDGFIDAIARRGNNGPRPGVIRALGIPWPETERAVPKLLPFLKRDPDDLKRLAAIDALTLIRSSTALDPLLQSIEHVSPDSKAYFETLEGVCFIDLRNEHAHDMLADYMHNPSNPINQRFRASNIWSWTELDPTIALDFWDEILDTHPEKHDDTASILFFYYHDQPTRVEILDRIVSITEETRAKMSALESLVESGDLRLTHLKQLESLSDDPKVASRAQRLLRMLNR